jgi:hypothetical protein
MGFICIPLDHLLIEARVSKVQQVQVTGVQVYGKGHLLLSTQEETASDRSKDEAPIAQPDHGVFICTVEGRLLNSWSCNVRLQAES